MALPRLARRMNQVGLGTVAMAVKRNLSEGQNSINTRFWYENVWERSGILADESAARYKDGPKIDFQQYRKLISRNYAAAGPFLSARQLI